MKNVLLSVLLVLAIGVQAQDADITPAAKGVLYGTALSATAKPIPVSELQSKLSNDAFEGQLSGKIKEVCQSMGCWITLEKADGTTLMVKMKDHAFFLPKDLAGRTVVIEGTAGMEDVTEKKRKHLAEDAGKSKEEIAKIKGPIKELHFTASGVKVVE